MDLSYHEKSTWCYLLVILGISLNYFPQTLGAVWRDPEVDFTDFVVLSTGTVIVLISAVSIFHTFISLRGGPRADAMDERDRRIDTRSTRNAYWVLAFGSFTLILNILAADVLFQSEDIGLLQPFGIANLLLLVFVVAELTAFLSKLIYYRHGI